MAHKSHSAFCSNQHSTAKAAAERTGRPIVRSQSAGDLSESPEPVPRHGSESPSKHSAISAGVYSNEDVRNSSSMMHMSQPSCKFT